MAHSCGRVFVHYRCVCVWHFLGVRIRVCAGVGVDVGVCMAASAVVGVGMSGVWCVVCVQSYVCTCFLHIVCACVFDMFYMSVYCVCVGTSAGVCVHVRLCEVKHVV